MTTDGQGLTHAKGSLMPRGIPNPVPNSHPRSPVSGLLTSVSCLLSPVILPHVMRIAFGRLRLIGMGQNQYILR